MSGCGQTAVSYDNPYDIYSTSADYGLASEGAGSEKTYFSQPYLHFPKYLHHTKIA